MSISTSKLKTKSHSSDSNRTRVLDVSGRKKSREPDYDEELDKPPKRSSKHADLARLTDKRRRDITLPKKLKKEMLPALLVEKRVSKLEKGKNKSILGDMVEEIHQLLERDNNESATSLIQKKLLQTLLDAIPLAENTIRETNGQRGVYQINSLITSVREIIIDMQSIRDRGEIAARLIEKVLRPIWMDIAMVLVKEDGFISNLIKASVSPEVAAKIERARHESLQRISHGLQQKYEEAKVQTETFLKQ
jgi:hypothetical protein